jgi:hypothetical protein
VPVPPAAGVLHDEGGPVSPVTETNVVPVGSVSENPAPSAASGPLLVTVIVYERSVPALAAAGPFFVIDRSEACTVVATLLLLFSGVGSLSEVTIAVLSNVVPPAVASGMLPVSMKVAIAEAGNDAIEQFTVPPEPTPGVVQFQAGGDASEMNVIVPGRVSLSTTFAPAFGPAFDTVIVYVTLLPGGAVDGPVLSTAMSPVGGGGVEAVLTPWLFSSKLSLGDATVAMLTNVVPGGVAGGT